MRQIKLATRQLLGARPSYRIVSYRIVWQTLPDCEYFSLAAPR